MAVIEEVEKFVRQLDNLLAEADEEKVRSTYELGIAEGKREILLSVKDMIGTVFSRDTAGLPPSVFKGVKSEVNAGRKIHAIKKLREFTGWGLKESKEKVEQIAEM